MDNPIIGIIRCDGFIHKIYANGIGNRTSITGLIDGAYRLRSLDGLTLQYQFPRDEDTWYDIEMCDNIRYRQAVKKIWLNVMFEQQVFDSTTLPETINYDEEEDI